MDLFDYQSQGEQAMDAPLATRMRPTVLHTFVGQEHIMGRGRVLRKAIEADRIPSMIFWGPPGSGKTTLANIIANSTQAGFSPVSATSASVSDLRKVIEQARERRKMRGQKTILFIDEIHRFNKAQQDVVLPHVEDGTITLIGATTENPSFEVISPLLSRARVLPLKPLAPEELKAIVTRALSDRLHGIGELKAELTPEAMDHLLSMAGSDARVALNTLELAALNTEPDARGRRIIEQETIEDAHQQRVVHYDKAGDQHFDHISALHKSLRGSDPDASLYWLGVMVEAGEDPMYIARRMVRFASEDVGMADPQALVIAMAAQQAVHFIGLPEGALALAEAAVYLATAPKSNALDEAYKRVKEEIKRGAESSVPLPLRNPVTPMMKEIGYGKDLQQVYDQPDNFVEQTYLPEHLQGKSFYTPSDQGFELEVTRHLGKLWPKKPREEGESPVGPGPDEELAL
ncbi:replication-associated recombination protein A [Chloroflexota bacterium]